MSENIRDENSKMNNKVTRIPGIPEDLVLTAEHLVTGDLVKRFVNQIMHQTLNKRDSGILRCTPGLTPMLCQVSSYPFLFYSTSEIVFNSVMDATGKEVFLTLAVGTSVPGDCMVYTIVSVTSKARENIPGFNF